MNVYADELENVKSVSSALKDDGYSVYSIANELDQLDVFFLALKAGLVFVGTISILIASTISIGVAMISGWRPARKATKIDVINALRQEL
ncbi:hypothetical protein [Sporosarcina limicola]|uniref:ABC-type antimicrobial peptide transport system permease subunit n=1 Tax=Sporosarcina limicola TaxID=34101 RepID=A0A927MKQ5_9BACL|nr:hypothetical protein [Sporosarcina limicola]MBE1552986.1 ABC-type antimicrobial peptide transport system permease subunit [Sporosarcina limicola]